MNRLIITGANGSGKSHLAARLAELRPNVPIISFDVIKLQTGWQQRPRSEITSSLHQAIKGNAWILEGGPSLLPHAIAKADGLVWLDPSELVRAWRLAIRPWRFLGRTRPELPSGNIDWPLQQYRFALRSLKNRAKFQSDISATFSKSGHIEKWHCRDSSDVHRVIAAWTKDTS